MIKLQVIKSGEIVEFKSVKEWENYILGNSDREKINKGHLYNVINGKSKSCYGFKLADMEIPKTENPTIPNWREIDIVDENSLKDFVNGFLMEEYNFIGPEIEFGFQNKPKAYGYFSWSIRKLTPSGIYLTNYAIKGGDKQMKGTLIHEALHYKLFVEKKGFVDGQKNFEEELKRLKEKYPEFKISSNHDFEIVNPGAYKTFVNKIRKKYDLPTV